MALKLITGMYEKWCHKCLTEERKKKLKNSPVKSEHKIVIWTK